MLLHHPHRMYRKLVWRCKSRVPHIMAKVVTTCTCIIFMPLSDNEKIVRKKQTSVWTGYGLNSRFTGSIMRSLLYFQKTESQVMCSYDGLSRLEVCPSSDKRTFSVQDNKKSEYKLFEIHKNTSNKNESETKNKPLHMSSFPIFILPKDKRREIKQKKRK